MYVITTVVGVLLVAWGSRRMVRKYQEYRSEQRHPGYIVAWHVDPSRDGFPRYYTFEMRRAPLSRRRRFRT